VRTECVVDVSASAYDHPVANLDDAFHKPPTTTQVSTARASQETPHSIIRTSNPRADAFASDPVLGRHSPGQFLDFLEVPARGNFGGLQDGILGMPQSNSVKADLTARRCQWKCFLFPSSVTTKHVSDARSRASRWAYLDHRITTRSYRAYMEAKIEPRSWRALCRHCDRMIAGSRNHKYNAECDRCNSQRWMKGTRVRGAPDPLCGSKLM